MRLVGVVLTVDVVLVAAFVASLGRGLLVLGGLAVVLGRVGLLLLGLLSCGLALELGSGRVVRLGPKEGRGEAQVGRVSIPRPINTFRAVFPPSSQFTSPDLADGLNAYFLSSGRSAGASVAGRLLSLAAAAGPSFSPIGAPAGGVVLTTSVLTILIEVSE